MVGVEVAHDEQRYPPDSEPVQAAVGRRRIGAGVDHDGLPRRGRQHHRVALPDVAHDHQPAGRGPAAGDQPDRQRAEDGRDRGHAGQPAYHRMAPEQDDGEQYRREQESATGTPEPRHTAGGGLGTVPGDQHQPAGRPGGEPGGEPGTGRPHRRQQRRGHTDDGRGRYGRYRDHVRRHGHQSHRGGQSGQHGRAGQLGRGRDGDRVGEDGRYAPAAQRVAPAGGDQQQSGRGQHGQRETRVGGQLGIEQHEQRHDRGQRGYRRRPAQRQRDQSEPGHRGSPQHARRRAHQDDEPDERQHAHGRREPGAGPAPAHEGEYQPDDHGHVRAADGDQVGHAGGPEVVGNGGVEPAGVADDQSGQQATRFVGQWCAGALQSGAQPAGRALVPGRRSDGRRRTGRGQDSRPQVTAARRGQPAGRRHRLPRQQGTPRRVAGQHEYPHGQVYRRRAVEPHQVGRHRVLRRPAGHAPDGSRVVANDEVGPDRGLPVGQCGQRRRVAYRHPGRGASGARDDPEQDRDQRTGHRSAHAPQPDRGEPGRSQRDGRAGAPRQVQPAERGQPRPRRQPGQPEVGPAHTVTRSLSWAYRVSPIPWTWRSSVTDRNPPCRVR